MGRSGRPKKAGAREPNGDLKRPSAAQRREDEKARRLGETRFVVYQPHRRGETHYWAGSVFGRFCLSHGLKPEIYDAGQRFGEIVSQWRNSRGIPVSRNSSPGPTPIERGDEEQRKHNDKLRHRMIECERVLCSQSTEAFIAVRQLVVDEIELSWTTQEHHAVLGLNALAAHLGATSRKPSRPYHEMAAG